ncbi:hypothetical protein C8R44DRAFT_748129 [Mycena epipterygia]|nr:hypothetical protein C8R44DRAFT_748129 [Mycena epipterygia]
MSPSANGRLRSYDTKHSARRDSSEDGWGPWSRCIDLTHSIPPHAETPNGLISELEVDESNASVTILRQASSRSRSKSVTGPGKLCNDVKGPEWQSSLPETGYDRARRRHGTRKTSLWIFVTLRDDDPTHHPKDGDVGQGYLDLAELPQIPTRIVNALEKSNPRKPEKGP